MSSQCAERSRQSGDLDLVLSRGLIPSSHFVLSFPFYKSCLVRWFSKDWNLSLFDRSSSVFGFLVANDPQSEKDGTFSVLNLINFIGNFILDLELYFF